MEEKFEPKREIVYPGQSEARERLKVLEGKVVASTEVSGMGDVVIVFKDGTRFSVNSWDAYNDEANYAGIEVTEKL